MKTRVYDYLAPLLILSLLGSGAAFTSCSDDDDDDIKPEEQVSADSVKMDTAQVYSILINSIFTVDSATEVTYTPRYGVQLNSATDVYSVGVESEEEASSIYWQFIPASDSANVKVNGKDMSYSVAEATLSYSIGSGDEIAHVTLSGKGVPSYELSFIPKAKWPENGFSPVNFSSLYSLKGRYYVCVSQGAAGCPARLVTFDIDKSAYGTSVTKYNYSHAWLSGSRGLKYWNAQVSIDNLSHRIASDDVFKSLSYLMVNLDCKEQMEGLRQGWKDSKEGLSSRTYSNVVEGNFFEKYWCIGQCSWKHHDTYYQGFDVTQRLFLCHSNGVSSITSSTDDDYNNAYSKRAYREYDCTGKWWYSNGFVSYVELSSAGNKTFEDYGFTMLY